MTVKGRTESRWRFKRPPATHNLLIDFVHRADRFQYYDSAALCSAGRGLCGLSTALRIHWTLWAPSNRISGKISQKRIPPCRCPHSGTIGQALDAQMRAGHRTADVCPTTNGVAGG